jgi:hypothetical protein
VSDATGDSTGAPFGQCQDNPASALGDAGNLHLRPVVYAAFRAEAHDPDARSRRMRELGGRCLQPGDRDAL